jgi:hypothetical protein
MVAELLAILWFFSQNKSCKPYFGPMLPPGGRNWQLISPHCCTCLGSLWWMINGYNRLCCFKGYCPMYSCFFALSICHLINILWHPFYHFDGQQIKKRSFTKSSKFDQTLSSLDFCLLLFCSTKIWVTMPIPIFLIELGPNFEKIEPHFFEDFFSQKMFKF